jgi:hypothetical protein
LDKLPAARVIVHGKPPRRIRRHSRKFVQEAQAMFCAGLGFLSLLVKA